MRSVLRFGVWVKGSRRSLSSARSLGKRVTRIGVGLGGFVRSVAGSTVVEGRLAGVFQAEPIQDSANSRREGRFEASGLVDSGEVCSFSRVDRVGSSGKPSSQIAFGAGVEKRSTDF
ncbi:hypothetical protein F5882DRAFT_375535 [Hyaloscypha sp. PMI_1271]|nr:hypothetical protein F5882DRAFT_375535 [Hyaloscypha sp. PMI_1271]